MSESQFELRITNGADAAGYWWARVYENGQWVKSFMGETRDAAKTDAVAWVEWYRRNDHTEEVIAL